MKKFLSEIKLNFRWKLRTKHRVAVSGTKKPTSVDHPKKDFSEDEAAMEIQRFRFNLIFGLIKKLCLRVFSFKNLMNFGSSLLTHTSVSVILNKSRMPNNANNAF